MWRVWCSPSVLHGGRDGCGGGNQRVSGVFGTAASFARNLRYFVTGRGDLTATSVAVSTLRTAAVAVAGPSSGAIVCIYDAVLCAAVVLSRCRCVVLADACSLCRR